MNLTVLTPPRWKSLNGIRVIECCVCVRYSEFKNKCHLKMLILTANYFCCLSSDFRERKTKRTLHRWCLHNWKHTFFNPYLLIISLIPGAIAYYLVHLQRGFNHFIYFALVLFVCMMLVESLMMIVASLVPDFLMGIITGAGIQGVMMLNGGFFRLPNDLPKPFWKYPMYYIAFHKYANQGFYKNEFEGLVFPNNQVGGGATITGEQVLRNFWQVEMGYSKWVDLAILIGMVVLYRFMFLGIIKLTEKLKPVIRSLMSAPPKHSDQM